MRNTTPRMKSRDVARPSLQFPRAAGSVRSGDSAASIDPLRRSNTADDVIAAFSTVSRKIHDLARELKCLGYFEDENHDRPRAA